MYPRTHINTSYCSTLVSSTAKETFVSIPTKSNPFCTGWFSLCSYFVQSSRVRVNTHDKIITGNICSCAIILYSLSIRDSRNSCTYTSKKNLFAYGLWSIHMCLNIVGILTCFYHFKSQNDLCGLTILSKFDFWRRDKKTDLASTWAFWRELCANGCTTQDDVYDVQRNIWQKA